MNFFFIQTFEKGVCLKTQDNRKNFPFESETEGFKDGFIFYWFQSSPLEGM
jgi:hypothetical protein